MRSALRRVAIASKELNSWSTARLAAPRMLLKFLRRPWTSLQDARDAELSREGGLGAPQIIRGGTPMFIRLTVMALVFVSCLGGWRAGLSQSEFALESTIAFSSNPDFPGGGRSEERRVGKECRDRRGTAR